MNVAMSAVIWQLALVYLDRIVVFNRSAMEHNDRIEHVLMLLCDVGVSLKLKQCNCFQKGNHVRYDFRPRHIEIGRHTTSAIKKLSAPPNATELKLFVGSCKAYR